MSIGSFNVEDWDKTCAEYNKAIRQMHADIEPRAFRPYRLLIITIATLIHDGYLDQGEREFVGAGMKLSGGALDPDALAQEFRKLKQEEGRSERQQAADRLNAISGVDDNGCIVPPDPGTKLDRSPSPFWQTRAGD